MRIIKLLSLVGLITFSACNTTNSTISTTESIPTKQYDMGRVTYTIEIDTDNEMVKKKFGTQATIEFNTALLKFTKNDVGSGFEFQLIELTKNKTWNYLNFLDNKFRIPEDESMTPKMGTFIFHDTYQTIAGFKCQKMTAPMGDGEMIAFVTKEIKANYCPYLNIDGFALAYSLPLPFGVVSYQATEFEPTTPTLSIDNNYITYPSLRAFQASIQENTDNLVGQKVSAFNIKDLNGNAFSSDDLKNKITVFNFWFTSCAPCITEIPDLNELTQKYKNEPVQFVAITFDEAQEVLPFLEKHPFEFQIFPDQKELVNQLKIRSFPTTFITDKSGNIIHSETGGSFSILEDLSIVIDAAIKEK